MVSIQMGRLSLPADYDDVAYLSSAQQWLNETPMHGIFGNLLALINQHAPIATALAALSFALGGAVDWPPYVANGVLLALTVLGAMLFLKAEKLPLWLAGFLALCLVAVPFFQQAVTEFRPDPFAGMAIAFCMLLLFRAPVFSLSRNRQFALGLLFGAALLMKPSVFLAAGFILAVAVLSSCAGFLIERKLKLREQAGSIVRSLGWLLAGAMVVFGPYLIAQGGAILGYTYMALFTLADVNDFNGSFAQHASFYATGLGGGGIALGPWFWLGTMTMAARLVATWRNDPQRLPSLGAGYAALLVIYLVLTLTAVKHYFLGSMFYATFSLFMLRDLAWLLPRAFVNVDGLNFPYGIVVLLIFLAVQTVFVPAPVLVTAVPDPAYRDTIRSATLLVWQVAKDKSAAADGVPAPVTILTNTGNPVRVPAIALQGMRERQEVRFSDGLYVRSVEEFLALAEKADIIVVSRPIGDPYPGSRLGDALQTAMAENKQFRSVASIADGFVQLYERADTSAPSASAAP
jgi:4-amino-4-deoxy-L-arabinose transferase-like glycosyltransferase